MSHETPQTEAQQTPIPEESKDRNSAKLTGAKDALKQKLLRAVMQQAMSEIGEPDAIADKVLRAFRSEMPQVPAASNRLRELIIAEITRTSLDSIKDPESTAREIGDSISTDHERIRSVVGALGDYLARSIQEAALDSIADAPATATEIARHISLEQHEVQSVIEALRDRLTTSVKDLALATFENVEDVAQAIRSSISDDDELLAAVRTRVYKMLVGESRDVALSRMEDSESVASEIREELGDHPEAVVRIAYEIRNRLTDEARRRSVESLSSTESVASEIISTMGEDPEVVSNAVAHVRSELLDEISRRSLEEMSDTVLAASDARKRLKPDPDEVVNAIEHLKDLLLREVVQQSKREFSDPKAAAGEAFKRLDLHSSELRRVKEELKSKILSHVLNSAIHEISNEVGTAAGELGSSLLGEAAAGFETEDLDAAAAELFEETSAPQDELQSFSDQEQEITGEEREVTASNEDAWTSRDDDDTAVLETFFGGEGFESEVVDGEEGHWIEETGEGASGETAESDEESVHSWQTLDSFDVGDADFEVAAYDPSTDSDGIAEELPQDAVSDHSEQLLDAEPISEAVYYVYGIMTAAGDAFDGPLPLGIQSGRVETVDYDGLCAVVSVVPTSIFHGEALKNNLGKASWLQENVRKHAAIIEQLRSRQTLLPMPFCTILPNRDKVVRMLEASYGQYFDSLDRLHGKQEWGLRIYRNRDLLQSKVSESNRRVEGALGAISRGVSGYLRDEMHRMEQESRQDPVELVTEHCAQRSHEALLARAAEGRQNPDRVGQERDGEELALNTAYLVEDNADAEMRAEVERLKAEYSELGFRFELTGPWPPYHFVGADGSRAAIRSAQ